MRTNQTVDVLRQTGLFLAALFALTQPVAGAAALENAAEALKVGTNSIPKSVFVDDGQGRDPFFPNSTRRQFKEPIPDVASPVGPASLVLFGFTGPIGDRVALINNQSFRAGEENKVRVPGGTSLVRCEEIREGSVIVTIQGGTERFEIHLRDRTLPIAPESQGGE